VAVAREANLREKGNTVPEPSNLTAALSCINRGWHIAPVNVNYLPSGKKKVEFLVPWGSEATIDPGVVLDWYTEHPYAGIAIATKPSHIVGIDLDVINGEAVGIEEWIELLGANEGQGAWLDTYAVNTPSGGLHLYFNDPDNRACNSASSIAPGIDVRGGGGSRGGVLFAPPTHTGRGDYTVHADVPLLDLPEWGWRLIEKKRPVLAPGFTPEPASLLDEPMAGGTPASTGQARERVWALRNELAGWGAGANHAAARLAYMAGQYVGAGQLDYADVNTIMVTALEGWTFDGCSRETMENTIVNQIREGAKNPRPWGAESAKEGPKPTRRAKDGELEFTDAAMAEYIADEVLRGKYVRTRGLGWMRWTGTHWRPCDDGAPVEAVRKFVRTKHIESIRKDLASKRDWAKYNAAGKITSIVALASNMSRVLREAEELDQYPDLINTPDGVLNLVTMQTGPHDPELLLTKITNASYRAGHETEDFATALECVPKDARDWLRAHLGAGVSGRPKPRVPAVLLTGEGRNGKTLLMETALEALGGIDGQGYAVQVPNELLLTGRTSGGPSPEKLTLRGARFAYVEETPEGRYLDINALKRIIATGVTTARDMYKSLVSFRLTHILFINTNHPPRVTETDTATWDRLTSLYFPYRYRKANDGLGPWLENDRVGLPTLADDLRSRDNLDAMFTWMVDGYRAGRTDQVDVPSSVVASVATWRQEGDPLLRFLEDTFVFDRDAWVTTQALYGAYRTWSERSGQQKPPPMNTFISRLKGHTGLTDMIAVRRVISTTPGLSSPEALDYVIEGAGLRAPLGRQSMGALGLRFRTAED
jgi:putative DNA primase/helicase